MQFSCNPIHFKPPKRIQHISLQRVPRQRHVSMLTSCLSTASFFADLHHGGFGPRGRVWTGAYWHCDKADWRKCCMPSSERPLGDGVAVHWSRLNIATNVVRRHLPCESFIRSHPRYCEVHKLQRLTANAAAHSLWQL
jgi:hypothetical protein